MLELHLDAAARYRPYEDPQAARVAERRWYTDTLPAARTMRHVPAPRSSPTQLSEQPSTFEASRPLGHRCLNPCLLNVWSCVEGWGK